MTSRTRLAALLAGVLVAASAQVAQAAPPGASLHLEELTSPELRERIAAGATTALVPIGGTEQNGPHMTLGKHNARVRILAERIAAGLGNAVVAPVIAYVPEGSIDPPAAHMRFTGTISVPEAAFEGVLEGAARSLRRHGFTDVVFLGDHGGYRRSEERVAARLSTEWRGKARVLAPVEYYRAAQDGHAKLLAARGFPPSEIGTHAGLADTALTLALDAAQVRSARLADAGKAGAAAGVYGDPRRASEELGRLGADHIVAETVAAIRTKTTGETR